MSPTTSAAEVVPILCGAASAGIRACDLAEPPGDVPALFDTMVSGAMRSIDGPPGPTIPGPQAFLEAVFELSRPHGPWGGVVVPDSSPAKSPGQPSHAEARRFAAEKASDGIPSPRGSMPSSSPRRLPGLKPKGVATGSTASPDVPAVPCMPTVNRDPTPGGTPMSVAGSLPAWWIAVGIGPGEAPAPHPTAQPFPPVVVRAIGDERNGLGMSPDLTEGQRIPREASMSSLGSGSRNPGSDAPDGRSVGPVETEAPSPSRMGPGSQARPGADGADLEEPPTVPTGVLDRDARPCPAVPVESPGGKPVERLAMEGSGEVDAEVRPIHGMIPLFGRRAPWLTQTRWSGGGNGFAAGPVVGPTLREGLPVAVEKVSSPPISSQQAEAPGSADGPVTRSAPSLAPRIGDDGGVTDPRRGFHAALGERGANPCIPGHDSGSDRPLVTGEGTRPPTEDPALPDSDAACQETRRSLPDFRRSSQATDSAAVLSTGGRTGFAPEAPRQRWDLPPSGTADVAYGTSDGWSTSAVSPTPLPPSPVRGESRENPMKTELHGSSSNGGMGSYPEATASSGRSGTTSAPMRTVMVSDRSQPSVPEGAFPRRDPAFPDNPSDRSASTFAWVDPHGAQTAVSTDGSGPVIQGETDEAIQGPQPRSVGRLAEQLSGEAILMQRLRAGAMTAVLKPDAHSELRVDLRRRDGRLEIRAMLERGDSQAIAEGWPDLQRQLGSQGVHLLPIERSPNLTIHRDSLDSGGDRPSSHGGRGKNPQTHQEPRDGVPSGRAGEGRSSRPVSSRSSKVSGSKPEHRHLLESWA